MSAFLSPRTLKFGEVGCGLLHPGLVDPIGKQASDEIEAKLKIRRKLGEIANH